MKLWLAFSTFLAFAAGCAVVFVFFQGPTRSSADPTQLPFQEVYLDIPPYLITSEEVYRQLGLDENQRAVMDFLLASHYKRVKDIRLSLQELSEDLLTGVHAVLTPKQHGVFEEIQGSYGERETQSRVRLELMRLRPDLNLTPEIEARVYQILYDSARERKDWWRLNSSTDRQQVRAKMREISSRRDARLKEVLSAEQHAKYLEMKERERKWRSERKERRNKNTEGAEKADSPVGKEEAKE